METELERFAEFIAIGALERHLEGIESTKQKIDAHIAETGVDPGWQFIEEPGYLTEKYFTARAMHGVGVVEDERFKRARHKTQEHVQFEIDRLDAGVISERRETENLRVLHAYLKRENDMWWNQLE